MQSPQFIAIIGGVEERDAALADAAQLRSLGYQVEYPLKNQNFGKQFKAANQSGARFALIYGSEELERDAVKVRDLATGKETEIARTQLIARVADWLESGIA